MQKTRFLAYTAMTAAVYVVMTLGVAPLSFGAVQIRFSEALMLLAFLDKRYSAGLILGCLIANFFSPLGMMDVIFGTTCTAAALYGMTHFSKTLFTSSLWPVFCNMFLAIEFYLLEGAPIVFSAVTVALGEFLAVSCVGYVIFRQILKNKTLMAQLQFH